MLSGLINQADAVGPPLCPQTALLFACSLPRFEPTACCGSPINPRAGMLAVALFKPGGQEVLSVLGFPLGTNMVLTMRGPQNPAVCYCSLHFVELIAASARSVNRS